MLLRELWENVYEIINEKLKIKYGNDFDSKIVKILTNFVYQEVSKHFLFELLKSMLANNFDKSVIKNLITDIVNCIWESNKDFDIYLYYLTYKED